MKTTKTKDLRSSTMRFLIDNKAMLLALLALIAASVISPTFFSFQNLRNVIRQNTTYFVLASALPAFFHPATSTFPWAL